MDTNKWLIYPFHPGVKPATMSALPIATHGGVLLQDLVSDV